MNTLPPLERLRRRFVFHDSRPGVLLWRDGPRAGNAAGTPRDSRGYLMVRLNGQALYVHRVVWALAHGQDPGAFLIDHVDGNRANNDPANLRLVNNAQNVGHRVRLNRNNTSGVRGVYWHTRCGKWAAARKVNGVRHHLGLFETIDQATEALKGKGK